MLTEFFLSCLDNLLRYRFRTFLTLLAIVLGSFSIVVMTSLAESGMATITRGLERLGGSRIILLLPKQPERVKEKASYSPGLSRDDMDMVRDRVPYIDSISAMRTFNNQEIRKRSQTIGIITDIVGTDEAGLRAYDMSLASGRNFVSADQAECRRVILLGDDVREKLFGDTYPLNEEVSVLGVSYRIIGYIARNYKLGIQLGFDWNNFAMIPERTLTDREQIQIPIEILITTTDRQHNEIVKRIINTLVERRHNGVDDFSFLDFNLLLGQFETIHALIKMIVAFISSIALIIGGVGVMNIMLVSVNQRMQEIGVRRAVGATPRAIIVQFLMESSILTIVGSFIGIALALGLVIASGPLITMVQPSWASVISWNSVLFALISAILVGNVFGFVPARRASRFVIDRCLRAERG